MYLISERFQAMKSCPNTYYVAVIEDIRKKQVVGTATLVVEQKFIHSTATVRICELSTFRELLCRGSNADNALIRNVLGKCTITKTFVDENYTQIGMKLKYFGS